MSMDSIPELTETSGSYDELPGLFLPGLLSPTGKPASLSRLAGRRPSCGVRMAELRASLRHGAAEPLRSSGSLSGDFRSRESLSRDSSLWSVRDVGQRVGDSPDPSSDSSRGSSMMTSRGGPDRRVHGMSAVAPPPPPQQQQQAPQGPPLPQTPTSASSQDNTPSGSPYHQQAAHISRSVSDDHCAVHSLLQQKQQLAKPGAMREQQRHRHSWETSNPGTSQVYRVHRTGSMSPKVPDGERVDPENRAPYSALSPAGQARARDCQLKDASPICSYEYVDPEEDVLCVVQEGGSVTVTQMPTGKNSKQSAATSVSAVKQCHLSAAAGSSAYTKAQETYVNNTVYIRNSDPTSWTGRSEAPDNPDQTRHSYPEMATYSQPDIHSLFAASGSKTPPQASCDSVDEHVYEEPSSLISPDREIHSGLDSLKRSQSAISGHYATLPCRTKPLPKSSSSPSQFKTAKMSLLPECADSRNSVKISHYDSFKHRQLSETPGGQGAVRQRHLETPVGVDFIRQDISGVRPTIDNCGTLASRKEPAAKPCVTTPPPPDETPKLEYSEIKRPKSSKNPKTSLFQSKIGMMFTRKNREGKIRTPPDDASGAKKTQAKHGSEAKTKSEAKCSASVQASGKGASPKHKASSPASRTAASGPQQLPASGDVTDASCSSRKRDQLGSKATETASGPTQVRSDKSVSGYAGKQPGAPSRSESPHAQKTKKGIPGIARLRHSSGSNSQGDAKGSKARPSPLPMSGINVDHIKREESLSPRNKSPNNAIFAKAGPSKISSGSKVPTKCKGPSAQMSSPPPSTPTKLKSPDVLSERLKSDALKMASPSLLRQTPVDKVQRVRPDADQQAAGHTGSVAGKYQRREIQETSSQPRRDLSSYVVAKLEKTQYSRYLAGSLCSGSVSAQISSSGGEAMSSPRAEEPLQPAYSTGENTKIKYSKARVIRTNSHESKSGMKGADVTKSRLNKREPVDGKEGAPATTAGVGLTSQKTYPSKTKVTAGTQTEPSLLPRGSKLQRGRLAGQQSPADRSVDRTQTAPGPRDVALGAQAATPRESAPGLVAHGQTGGCKQAAPSAPSHGPPATAREGGQERRQPSSRAPDSERNSASNAPQSAEEDEASHPPEGPPTSQPRLVRPYASLNRSRPIFAKFGFSSPRQIAGAMLGDAAPIPEESTSATLGRQDADALPVRTSADRGSDTCQSVGRDTCQSVGRARGDREVAVSRTSACDHDDGGCRPDDRADVGRRDGTSAEGTTAIGEADNGQSCQLPSHVRNCTAARRADVGGGANDTVPAAEGQTGHNSGKCREEGDGSPLTGQPTPQIGSSQSADELRSRDCGQGQPLQPEVGVVLEGVAPVNKPAECDGGRDTFELDKQKTFSQLQNDSQDRSRDHHVTGNDEDVSEFSDAAEMGQAPQVDSNTESGQSSDQNRGQVGSELGQHLEGSKPVIEERAGSGPSDCALDQTDTSSSGTNTLSDVLTVDKQKTAHVDVDVDVPRSCAEVISDAKQHPTARQQLAGMFGDQESIGEVKDKIPDSVTHATDLWCDDVNANECPIGLIRGGPLLQSPVADIERSPEISPKDTTEMTDSMFDSSKPDTDPDNSSPKSRAPGPGDVTCHFALQDSITLPTDYHSNAFPDSWPSMPDMRPLTKGKMLILDPVQYGSLDRRKHNPSMKRYLDVVPPGVTEEGLPADSDSSETSMGHEIWETFNSGLLQGGATGSVDAGTFGNLRLSESGYDSWKSHDSSSTIQMGKESRIMALGGGMIQEEPKPVDSWIENFDVHNNDGREDNQRDADSDGTTTVSTVSLTSDPTQIKMGVFGSRTSIASQDTVHADEDNQTPAEGADRPPGFKRSAAAQSTDVAPKTSVQLGSHDKADFRCDGCCQTTDKRPPSTAMGKRDPTAGRSASTDGARRRAGERQQPEPPSGRPSNPSGPVKDAASRSADKPTGRVDAIGADGQMAARGPCSASVDLAQTPESRADSDETITPGSETLASCEFAPREAASAAAPDGIRRAESPARPPVRSRDDRSNADQTRTPADFDPDLRRDRQPVASGIRSLGTDRADGETDGCEPGARRDGEIISIPEKQTAGSNKVTKQRDRDDIWHSGEGGAETNGAGSSNRGRHGASARNSGTDECTDHGSIAPQTGVAGQIGTEGVRDGQPREAGSSFGVPDSGEGRAPGQVEGEQAADITKDETGVSKDGDEPAKPSPGVRGNRHRESIKPLSTGAADTINVLSGSGRGRSDSGRPNCSNGSRRPSPPPGDDLYLRIDDPDIEPIPLRGAALNKQNKNGARRDGRRSAGRGRADGGAPSSGSSVGASSSSCSGDGRLGPTRPAPATSDLTYVMEYDDSLDTSDSRSSTSVSANCSFDSLEGTGVEWDSGSASGRRPYEPRQPAPAKSSRAALCPKLVSPTRSNSAPVLLDKLKPAGLALGGSANATFVDGSCLKRFSASSHLNVRSGNDMTEGAADGVVQTEKAASESLLERQDPDGRRPATDRTAGDHLTDPDQPDTDGTAASGRGLLPSDDADMTNKKPDARGTSMPHPSSKRRTSTGKIPKLSSPTRTLAKPTSPVRTNQSSSPKTSCPMSRPEPPKSRITPPSFNSRKLRCSPDSHGSRMQIDSRSPSPKKEVACLSQSRESLARPKSSGQTARPVTRRQHSGPADVFRLEGRRGSNGLDIKQSRRSLPKTLVADVGREPDFEAGRTTDCLGSNASRSVGSRTDMSSSSVFSQTGAVRSRLQKPKLQRTDSKKVLRDQGSFDPVEGQPKPKTGQEQKSGQTSKLSSGYKAKNLKQGQSSQQKVDKAQGQLILTPASPTDRKPAARPSTTAGPTNRTTSECVSSMDTDGRPESCNGRLITTNQESGIQPTGVKHPVDQSVGCTNSARQPISVRKSSDQPMTCSQEITPGGATSKPRIPIRRTKSGSKLPSYRPK